MPLLDVAVHEVVIAEVPPAVSQFDFWSVSVFTLTPVLVLLVPVDGLRAELACANAMCPAITEVLTTNTLASAAIATSAVAVLLFFMLVILVRSSELYYAISTVVHIKC